MSDGFKRAEKRKRMVTRDLSNLSGLSVRTIHRIENGHVKPSAESAKALAAVFELPFAGFLSSAEESPLLGEQVSNANSP